MSFKQFKDITFAVQVVLTLAMFLVMGSCHYHMDQNPSGHRPALPSAYEGGGIQG